jgi:hypothetical protein
MLVGNLARQDLVPDDHDFGARRHPSSGSHAVYHRGDAGDKNALLY